MRKIREVLRLRYEVKLGHRAIAASCAIGRASVCGYVKRAETAGLTWQHVTELGDAEIESRLFGSLVMRSRVGDGAEDRRKLATIEAPI